MFDVAVDAIASQQSQPSILAGKFLIAVKMSTSLNYRYMIFLVLINGTDDEEMESYYSVESGETSNHVCTWKQN